jgi:hypothetical protein
MQNIILINYIIFIMLKIMIDTSFLVIINSAKLLLTRVGEDNMGQLRYWASGLL